MGGFAAFAEFVTPPEADPNCASPVSAFCLILEALIRPRNIPLHSREESFDEPAIPFLFLSDCCRHDPFLWGQSRPISWENSAIVSPLRFTQSQGPSVS